MDALLLRRSFARRGLPPIEAAIKTRPNLLAGEDLLPEPVQKRSIEKRSRLKTAALSEFGAKGFEKAGVERIAKRTSLAVGSFYQHFRSKRQLLLALMDDLLEKLSNLNFHPEPAHDVRTGLRQLLSRAFSYDLCYLGAYRAWQEAVLSDPSLAHKHKQIHEWTTSRVATLFQHLQQLPNARSGVDLLGMAKTMDTLLWSLLAQAGQLRKAELNRQIDSATHLIYCALFRDMQITRGNNFAQTE